MILSLPSSRLDANRHCEIPMDAHGAIVLVRTYVTRLGDFEATGR